MSYANTQEVLNKMTYTEKVYSQACASVSSVLIDEQVSPLSQKDIEKTIDFLIHHDELTLEEISRCEDLDRTILDAYVLSGGKN
jgi:hypothetical protein